MEHTSFTHLVLLASGGLGNEATVFYKRLAFLLAEKWDQSYHQVINWRRCSISFSLLRAGIQCVRGSWSFCGHAISTIPPMDLVTAEAHLCHYTEFFNVFFVLFILFYLFNYFACSLLRTYISSLQV